MKTESPPLIKWDIVYTQEFNRKHTPDLSVLITTFDPHCLPSDCTNSAYFLHPSTPTHTNSSTVCYFRTYFLRFLFQKSYVIQDKRHKKCSYFYKRKSKMYLSIKSIAFSTLWKLFNDIFKAFHGYLHRQRIIPCIRLAILFKEIEKRKKIIRKIWLIRPTHFPKRHMCHDNSRS